jgi:hypothetical protein
MVSDLVFLAFHFVRFMFNLRRDISVLSAEKLNMTTDNICTLYLNKQCWVIAEVSIWFRQKAVSSGLTVLSYIQVLLQYLLNGCP